MSKKLSKYNINLLNVLDVLLSEKNITSASKKLFLTQPAISYSLKQLRDIFNDNLLVKNSLSSYMQLTPLAKSLVKPVRETVIKIESIFGVNEFSPADSRRQIKIATTDYLMDFLLSRLLRQLNIEAPFLSLHIYDILYSNPEEQMIKEDIDLGIGIFDLKPKQDTFRYEFLFNDRLVCCADKNHPAFQGEELTLEDYFRYPHISVRFPKNGWTTTLENSFYKTADTPNNINNITVHNTNEVFCLLAETEYIAIGCERLIKKYQNIYNLSIQKPPFQVNKVPFSLCTRIHKDQAIEWLIEKIKKIAVSIDESK